MDNYAPFILFGMLMVFIVLPLICIGAKQEEDKIKAEEYYTRSYKVVNSNNEEIGYLITGDNPVLIIGNENYELETLN